MMITLTDLTDRFGEKEIAELTDRDTYQTINPSVVAKAIVDAESDIESYLNAVGLVERDRLGRLIYTKALYPPASLIIKTCDIARYYLHEEGATGIVEERYKQAIDWLKLVMRNPAMLTGLTDSKGNTVGVNSGIAVIANAPPSMWTM